MSSQEARKALSEKPRERVVTGADYLSTGVTLINLACTGDPNYGIAKGHIYRFIGRSSSGKTFITRTVMAEACQNKNFDSYDLIYDDVERGALMDTEKFFGKKLANRMQAPARTRSKEPVYSRTLEDFYGRLRDRMEDGRSVIWVEDSMDSLVTDSETKMTDGKAKANSQGLRRTLSLLEKTKSILILISQAKSSLSPYGGDVTSGGTSLEYYSTLDVWLQKSKAIKVKYKKKDYVTGLQIRARVKKNRVSGLDRSVFFPFFPSYGIDDISSCVDYLTSTGHWKKTGSDIAAPELNFNGRKRDLVAVVEKESMEDTLRQTVAKEWLDIERACSGTRKPRYE